MSLSFRERLGGRDPDLPIAVTERGELRLGDLASGAGQGLTHKRLPRASRIALNIVQPETLIRMLATLDGRAASMLLISPGLAPEAVSSLCASFGTDVLVSDRADLPGTLLPGALGEIGIPDRADRETEWIMTTSGTTGQPKMVRHSLASLARTVSPLTDLERRPVWGLTYEPSRFAGLQVVLQSCLGDGTLVAPELCGDTGKVLDFLARHGCSHLSATPTLWQRFLMHPNLSALNLEQITLGGEIAGQALLTMLGRTFPGARITHVYASTEVGVGFSVRDGREGFPAAYVEQPPDGIGIVVRGDQLWLRPPGSQPDYLGRRALERDKNGYINSGDRVARRGDRYLFLGRDDATVNIGGIKVHPEEVELFIGALPGVGQVRVAARSSSIVGALLSAHIVPTEPVTDEAEFIDRILVHCRGGLPREAVPVSVRLVSSIEVNAAGKIRRS